MNSLLSKINSLNIQMQRGLDQTWRMMTGRPMALRSKITKNLFLGGQYDFGGIQTLKSWGITAIVNMRSISQFENEFKKLEIKYLHLPTVDAAAPSMESLITGIKFIKEELGSGGKVYVHCKYGEGRGPTMVIAYLMSTGLTYEDAFKQVQKVRTFVKPTRPQVARLLEFSEFLKKEI